MAVADGKLFTLGNVDNQDIVYALDANSGAELWTHAYDSDLDPKFFEGGPTSTPAVDGDVVYTLGRHGILNCLKTADGSVVWTRDLKAEHGFSLPSWGFSGSPVVLGDLLLLNVSGGGAAVKKSTGELVWKSDNGEAGYSTPYLYEEGGKTIAIFSTGREFIGRDAATGTQLWSLPWKTNYGVNASDPIVHDGQLFIASGYRKGCGLFKLGGAEPEKVWQNRDLRTQMNPAVLIDGFIYGTDGDQNARNVPLKCLDWKTGATKWEEPGIGTGGVIAADGTLIVLSAKGELILLPATSEGFKPTLRMQALGGKCWTAPVLANGKIYCRNADGDLVCLDVSGS